MEVCNIFLNNSNTFCKEIYTCTVFPVEFQLKGFVPLTIEKWGIRNKIGVQNRRTRSSTNTRR